MAQNIFSTRSCGKKYLKSNGIHRHKNMAYRENKHQIRSLKNLYNIVTREIMKTVVIP